jgi:YVTN family beta-propeller protein
MRGSAIALTSDDSTLVAVNRDVGSVSIFSVDYTSGQPALTKQAELNVGNEPWQVVVDGCGTTAYVVLRRDQKVVEITGLKTSPVVGRSVSVGSEPTSLALTPNNTQLYVSNWVDGTVSVIDPVSMTVSSTIDLNATIAATGFLGPDVQTSPRAALAHPRGIAITNNGDTSDTDETVYVSEWFAVRTNPEDPNNLGAADTNWKGLLYAIPVSTGTASTIDLPPVTNTGFNDAKGNQTGCFPNQVASVSLDNSGYAYVTSTCASPAGPTGVFQRGQCQVDANCTAFNTTTPPFTSTCDLAKGVCTGSCTTDAQCGVGSAVGACNIPVGSLAGECAPFTANAKTTTHPGLTIVNLAAGTATTVTLDTLFTTPSDITSGTVSTRMPLLQTDMDFKNSFGYVVAEGADALFRLTLSNGSITTVGSAASNADNGNFIDVRTSTNTGIHLPIGVVISKNKAIAFVNNDGSRDVEAVDLNTQAISSGASADVQSTALPTAGSAQDSVLQGKRFFTTGLGRWSLNGAAWGACAACHIDGLTDNVTWYFARGPRQSTSLDGTFNKNDPTDQRILNWTAVNDEIADFEGNVRGISGGVGAIVSAVSSPLAVTDRINLINQTPQQQGLQGSSADAANPNGTSAHPHSVINNWATITAYIQSIRSPRAPTNLNAADVAAGQTLFEDPGAGNCIACHSGAKWTISKVFYPPGDVPNDAFGSAATTSLSNTSWNANLNGFPSALFPSTVAGAKTFMRSGAPPTFEQLQCVLRPVGTIGAVAGGVPAGVSPAEVNVLELRQDMATGAQGAGGINANDFTRGFNPPSLLGLQVGAPYFHAGNARSLEESLSSTFTGHFQSPVAQVFAPTPLEIQQLVAFMLSIDGDTQAPAVPALGSSGGDICHYP